MFWNKPKLPSKSDIQWMCEQAPFTPDLALLEEQRQHVLFHWETGLKVQKSEDTGHRAYTRHKFNLYTDAKTGRGIPILGHRQSLHQPLRIKGKLLGVEPEGIKELDNTYQNGLLYNRVRVPLLVTHRTHEVIMRVNASGEPLPPALQGPKHILSPEKVASLEGWMYIASAKHWKPLLDGGYNFPLAPIKVPREPKPWLERFYQLQKDNG